jgi:hypothetical protein
MAAESCFSLAIEELPVSNGQCPKAQCDADLTGVVPNCSQPKSFVQKVRWACYLNNRLTLGTPAGTGQRRVGRYADRA